VFSFRDLVECLRSRFKSTIVEYEQGIKPAKEEASEKLELGNGEKRCYGVYIIYRVYSTEKKCEDLVKRGCGEVLYIGKGGTLESDARYNDQDVIGRICNTRSKGKTANQWFKDMKRCGRICIEIICIDVVDGNNRTPQCKLLTPAFIESLLLSCYLYERGKLPQFNCEL